MMNYEKKTTTEPLIDTGERPRMRRLALVVRGLEGAAVALAIERVLKTTAEPSRTLDALCLEGRSKPFVTFTDIPKCSI